MLVASVLMRSDAAMLVSQEVEKSNEKVMYGC
jgi:hypothetical protein